MSQLYLDAVARMRVMDRADWSGEIARLVERTGASRSTVQRRLRKAGLPRQRAKRSDAGTCIVTRDQCERVLLLMASGRNKRGQANLPMREAVEIAKQQGELPASVSVSTVSRALKSHGMSWAHLQAPAPSIRRVSKHSNHVWLVDVSVCVQWYFRDADTGKVLVQYDDAGARFNSNKPDNYKALRRVILRYLAVDHYSGAFYVRYYYEPGETAETMVDFLWRAMASKGLGDSYPFRGIPKRLVLDRGPGNTSALVSNLLENLGVQVEYHLPGNAKASGAVETRHNHWQRYFEGKQAQAKPGTLERLNTWAEAACAEYCATRDLRRNHTAKPPMARWLRGLKPGLLVDAPDQATFFALAAGAEKTGRLRAGMELRADGRTFLISGGKHLHVGMKLTWRKALTETGLRVWAGGVECAVEELNFDEAGFPTGGHRHVWDAPEEHTATAPSTPAQALVAQLETDDEDLDLGAGMAEHLDQLSTTVRRFAYLRQVESTPWAAQNDLAAEQPMGSLDAREELADRLDHPFGQLSAADQAWWRDRIAAGITPTELDSAWTEFTTASPARIAQNA